MQVMLPSLRYWTSAQHSTRSTTASCSSTSIYRMALMVVYCVGCNHISVTVFKRFSLPEKQSSRSTLTRGVPQGSVLGPIMFTLYTADVILIVDSFGVNIHCYADGMQLYMHCRAEKSAAAVRRMLNCIAAIDRWLSSNRLKMNPNTTQIIWLGSRQRLATINIAPLHLHDGTDITPSTGVHNLGVVFNSELSMSEHVNKVTSNCFYQLRQLRTVRRSLSMDPAKTLVHAFISSRLDYCNSLMFGTINQVMCKLQAIQNAAVRLVTGLGLREHITPALMDLH